MLRTWIFTVALLVWTSPWHGARGFKRIAGLAKGLPRAVLVPGSNSPLLPRCCPANGLQRLVKRSDTTSPTREEFSQQQRHGHSDFRTIEGERPASESSPAGSTDATESTTAVSRRTLAKTFMKACVGAALMFPTTAPCAVLNLGGRSQETLESERGSPSQASASSVFYSPASGGPPVALPPIAERTKRIFLARHGQTDFNALLICQGRLLDPPLNQKGRDQARRLFNGIDLGAIFCSPLLRARETAGLVRESHPSARLSVVDDLIEVDFGVAEGLPQPIAAAYLAPSYIAWSEGRLDAKAGGGGESGTAVGQRAANAAKALLSACKDGGQVLGVSHSSMVKFTLATLLDVPLGTIRRLGQNNCALNALDFDTVSGSFEAVLINDRLVRGRAGDLTPVA